MDVTGDGLCEQQYTSVIIHFGYPSWAAAWLVVHISSRILCTNLHILVSVPTLQGQCQLFWSGAAMLKQPITVYRRIKAGVKNWSVHAKCGKIFACYFSDQEVLMLLSLTGVRRVLVQRRPRESNCTFVSRLEGIAIFLKGGQKVGRPWPPQLPL